MDTKPCACGSITPHCSQLAWCLEGRARPTNDCDVRGLLQLATLIIYGNKVALNAFEDDVIAEQTRGIIEGPSQQLFPPTFHAPARRETNRKSKRWNITVASRFAITARPTKLQLRTYSRVLTSPKSCKFASGSRARYTGLSSCSERRPHHTVEAPVLVSLCLIGDALVPPG